MENNFNINSQQNEDPDSIKKYFHNDDKKRSDVSGFRRILPQILAVSAKNLLLLDLGAVLGYQTIIIGNILNVASQPSFTEDEASWFASLLFIGQPIGCLFAALILESIGRKKAMIVLNIPLFIGWIIISTTKSVLLLYMASLFLGLGAGFMESPTITYIGEVTEPKLRGIMTSISELILGAGSVVIYILGVWYDWRTIAYLCTPLPVISAIVIALIPESPIWLLAHKRTQEAQNALCWLRGWVPPEMIQKEFSELVFYRNSKISKDNVSRSELNNVYINQVSLADEDSRDNYETSYENKTITSRNRLQIEDIENNKEGQINNINECNENITFNDTEENKSQIKNLISDLMEPSMLHPLLFIIGFFFFQVAAGCNVVLAYTIPVFKELGFTLDPFGANVITSGAGILGTVNLVFVVSYLGRRKIALFSTLSTAILCIVIGVYALYPNNVSLESYWSFPFIIYTVNNYIYGFGLGPLPWMYVSEIFPFRGRGVATGISASMNYIFGFFVAKTFFTIKYAISLAGIFFLYGIISLVGFVYLYFLLPETEGKSLQDIEDNQTKIFKKPKMFSAKISP